MGLNVLVSDPISEEGLAVLRNNGTLKVDVQPDLPAAELIGRIRDYDGLIVRSGTQVTADVVAAAERLRVIGRAGVGVDNIDVKAATRKGIVVLNTPEANTVATAEHTIAMMLSLARRIPQAHLRLVRDEAWDRKPFVGVQIQGKHLGVLGLGRVGKHVARLALGLGMRVLAYDPYVSTEMAQKLGVELVEVDDICRRADFLTVHTPLTRATENLIGPRQFHLMQPGIRIINCARGGIIDESALLDGLEAGKVAGAALDVFREEPPVDRALLKSPGVVATPHLGASTAEAQVNVAVDVAHQLVRTLKGEPAHHAVNLPGLSLESLETLRPYIDLAQRLGRLYTDLAGGGHGQIEVTYSGKLAELDCAPVTRGLLMGLLNPILQDSVNIVNAPVVARERGIKVTETKQADHGDFPQLITVRGAHTGKGERLVAGTVAYGDTPTLVSIDGYRVNVSTPGHLLVGYNVDRAGMIGQVGTLLGENGINIAYMQVGRKTVGGHAVMVLGIDDAIPTPVLQQLQHVEDLWDTRLVMW